jgi:hypothetical protein
MVFVIAKIANQILPLFIDGWAVVDFNTTQWHLPFIMKQGFDAKILKGLKKTELMDVASRMRLRTQKSNKFNKTVDKNIAEMKETIQLGWSSFFKPAETSEVVVAAGEIAVELKKLKGMYNHGSMIECHECSRSWSINQGVQCVVCRRSWTKTGPSIATPITVISVDLIDLLGSTCDNNDDKGKPFDIIHSEDKLIKQKHVIT